jgi:ribosomal protein L7/L12
MMSSNQYAKAVRILADEKTDFRSLAYEIAALNPASLVRAAERLTVGFGWQRECAALLAGGNKVAAVKRHRELTGSSLKAALEAINSLPQE